MTMTATGRLLRSRWLRPVVIAVLCAAVAGAVFAPAAPPVRTVVLLLFFVLAPGLALVGLLRIREPWQELALVIGVSLAVDALVAGGLAYAGDGSSTQVLEVLLGIGAVGAVAQLRPRRHGRHVGEVAR
jgi:uncharacterized membrane protein